jgi:two-component system, LytTR family, response regulator AlgR
MKTDDAHGVNSEVLQVLIVDDEPLARVRLKALVDDLQGREGIPPLRVTEAGNAHAATQAMLMMRVSIVLLDVRMPGCSGLEWARSLRDDSSVRPVIIFTTAHQEHAFAAFELDATDYLSKPIRRDRLQTALRRACARHAAVREPLATVNGQTESALSVTERGRIHRIACSEILYLKAEWKYVTLRTAERPYLIEESLVDLEQRLGTGFLRVHRNALVALGSLVSLAWMGTALHPGWAVRVKTVDEWVDVSRRQLPVVRQALRQPPL